MYKFDANKTKNDLVQWIKDYFERNGSPETKAVIGISGGKDSAVTAALCVEALGVDRVVGVLMPDGLQSDIDYSHEICKHLGIDNLVLNIGGTVKAIYEELGHLSDSKIVTNNTPARVRMTMLYAVSGYVGGRVANTCNLSEDYVGYATKFGDAAGDFSPLSRLTVQEVKAIGRELGIPEKFIEKTPIDGLCGMTDEDNLGFTYKVLDRWIRESVCEDTEILEKILAMNKRGLHKLLPMPAFIPVITE